MRGESPTSGIKFRIRHTMLPVGDLDRTIDFYTRLLGMDLMRLRDEPERNMRTGYLGYGSQDDGPALELIQTGAADRTAKMPAWSGHVALYVSDLNKLCEKLKAEGVEFLSDARPNRPGGRDLVAFIQDPDGYTIELTERHSLTGPPLRER
jgi:lactoylglutathione lyase